MVEHSRHLIQTSLEPGKDLPHSRVSIQGFGEIFTATNCATASELKNGLVRSYFAKLRQGKQLPPAIITIVL